MTNNARNRMASAQKALMVAQDPWRELRRLIYLVVCPLGALALGAAMSLQYPDFDPVDLWALPTLAVTLLVIFVLLALRRIGTELASAIGYVAVALYFLLSLNHQYSGYALRQGHLAEATYWFATVYCLAFLAWDARAAALAAGATFVGTLLVGLAHLNDLRAAVAGSSQLLAFLLQFHLSSLVLLLMLFSFAFLKQHFSQLRLLAYMDFLTSLPNRRYAEELLTRRPVERRGAAGMTLVMFDIDHFKRVNDTHGHHIGDHVLREAALIVSRHLRFDQRLARWGGEEFLLALPGLSLNEGRELAERLRALLERHDFEEVGRVTASFGVAERLAGEDGHAALRRADAALYRAKQSGRNCVRCAGDGPDSLETPYTAPAPNLSDLQITPE